MALRERAAGAGFEVALEATSSRLVAEFDLHDQAPRTVRRGVAARSFVVPLETALHGGGDPNVVALWVRHAPQDVNESQWTAGHAPVIARSVPEVRESDSEGFH